MVFKPKETETFHDAALIFKNLKGEKRQYNAEGDRNFSIIMGEDRALELEGKGWNVKAMRRREEDDQQLYHLKVKVNFANKPPRVWLVSNIDPQTGIGRSRTMLGEGMIAILDDLEATRVDLVITAYDWDVSGNTGRTAYLESLFYTMYESELEREYADIPQISAVGDRAPRELESGRLRYADAIDAEEVD